jgi:large subunit ribosomal protein L27
VTYYRDPALNPKRKYIGIVFKRENTLPQPPNAPRRRQLGMLAYQMPATTSESTKTDLQPTPSVDPNTDAAVPETIVRARPQEERKTRTVITRRVGADGNVEKVETTLTLRPGYQWRQQNWEIGKAAERSPAAQAVKPFKPGDRWEAWRRSAARKARNAERRALGRGSKGKKKK